MTENTVSKGKVPARSDSELPATRESELYMSPAVDIFETPDGLTVLADVPGVTKDGLDIDVNDKILTIRGTVSLPKRENLVSAEYGMANYFRQFRLSDEVDESKIKASLDQGVLTLDLPKSERAKPKRIEVKAS
ncbi:MAG: Hsp20/alpha crystallin family protein [Candidatus Latescibacterota bacterium]|jgi:HSP20 family protein